MSEIKSGDKLPNGLIAVRAEDMADLYRRMLALVRLGQSKASELGKISPELLDLRLSVFDQADFGALIAGQMLPRDMRDCVRERSLQS